MSVFFHYSASTVAVYWQGGGGTAERTDTQCEPLYFLNVTQMLVNLTLLKPTVKHNANHDIIPAQTLFMI